MLNSKYACDILKGFRYGLDVVGNHYKPERSEIGNKNRCHYTKQPTVWHYIRLKVWDVTIRYLYRYCTYCDIMIYNYLKYCRSTITRNNHRNYTIYIFQLLLKLFMCACVYTYWTYTHIPDYVFIGAIRRSFWGEAPKHILLLLFFFNFFNYYSAWLMYPSPNLRRYLRLYMLIYYYCLMSL